MFNNILKFTVKIIDGCLYGFVGPFSIVFIIPQFLVHLSNKYGMPYYSFSGSEMLSKILMWSGAIIAIYCGFLMIFTSKGTPAVTSSPQKIMRTNIYAYVRHPMMWALTITLAGEVFFHGILLLLLWFFAWLRIKHLYVVNYEEPQLEKRFGDSWKDYCSKVPRWIPTFRKK
ncbi:MAG: isoprenylcysteine carboxylmethyltransferase family protein [Bacteroidales bacterium]|jgi:protein-S-isoprenylcysteine O-methyltransferase Ste14|nr:isoprenylcysteine carboxylmethyltransferase family protein [Bacteroidales bacterium]MDD4215059.1 isoprenylcysteine carboxylmethyltransferase family protein [Bacteroidales bacterium]